MKVNFSQKLTQINGQPLLDADAPNEDGNSIKQATAKSVVVNALMFPDTTDSGEGKLKKWNLANRIYSSDREVEISVEEANVIKKSVGKSFGPVVVGPVYNLLEGD